MIVEEGCGLEGDNKSGRKMAVLGVDGGVEVFVVGREV